MEALRYSQAARGGPDTSYDIDYVEITGPPKFLEEITKLEFTVGTFKHAISKTKDDYLLVAYQPGYVYAKVTEEQRTSIVRGLSWHFRVTLEKSLDPTVLLKSVTRRITSAGLVMLLADYAELSEIVYINYGMKADFNDYSWLSSLPPQCKVTVDVGVDDVCTIGDHAVLCRFTGGPMIDHIYRNYELFTVLQFGEGLAFGTCVMNARRNNPTQMVKARVYSKIVHSLKANVQAEFGPSPRKMKILRRYENYYKRIPVAYLRDISTCEDLRTEIRLRMRSFDTLIADFEKWRTQVYSRLEFRRMSLPEIMYSMPQILDWAKSKNVFQGNNNVGCSRLQVQLYHILNNSHGYAGMGSVASINKSRELIAQASQFYQAKRASDGYAFGYARNDTVDEVIEVMSDSEEEESKMDVDAGYVQIVNPVEVIDLINDEVYDDSSGDDEGELSEDSSERRQRYAPVPPARLRADVERHLFIVQEGRAQKFNVRTTGGSIWARAATRESLIDRVVEDLGENWREYVMMVGW
ncbi:hypothetical protein FI667_g11026, partial [Globisporangium splendens]